ncbi:MAG: hypothetical protein HY814_07550, partial [Candidatus Riflebacteria bacterium]|nr:hypothetical protein [Candidatus Riflebacteria bacterium]
ELHGAALDFSLLEPLGETALVLDYLPLAYATTVSGVARRGPEAARALLLRAHSLLHLRGQGARRATCLRAALTLARRAHAAEVVQRALDVLAAGRRAAVSFFFSTEPEVDWSARELSAAELESVLAREGLATCHPSRRVSLRRTGRGRRDPLVTASQGRLFHVEGEPRARSTSEPPSIPPSEKATGHAVPAGHPPARSALEAAVGELMIEALIQDGLPPEFAKVIVEVIEKHGDRLTDMDVFTQLPSLDPELGERFGRALEDLGASGAVQAIAALSAVLGDVSHSRRRRKP